MSAIRRSRWVKLNANQRPSGPTVFLEPTTDLLFSGHTSVISILVPELGLGCGSLCILGSDLSFGAEPVVEVVTVLAAAFLIEFIRPAADLFFKITSAGKGGISHGTRHPHHY